MEGRHINQGRSSDAQTFHLDPPVRTLENVDDPIKTGTCTHFIRTPKCQAVPTILTPSLWLVQHDNLQNIRNKIISFS